MSLATPAFRHKSCSDSFPVISITAPPEPPPARHRHIVAVVGPYEEHNVRTLADECFRMGLSLRIIHTDSDDFNEATLDKLYASGEIGPGTHLILLGHGDNASDKHLLHTSDYIPDNEEFIAVRTHETLGLLMWLRQTHEFDATSGKRVPWKGMVHVLSCGAQIMGTQIAESNEARAAGPNLIYGDLDSHGSSESSLALQSICEFIHLHGKDKMVAPTAMMAWVGRTAAVPVTLVGGDVHSPIVLEPAVSVGDAMPALLSGRLRQQQVEQAFDAASAAGDRNARRLAIEALRREDGRPDSLILQQNLARVVHEQVVNQRFDNVAALLCDAPPLVHTINAFAAPLDAVVEPAHLPRYRKMARSASRKCHQPVNIAARAAQPSTGKPVRRMKFRKDSVLEAVVRRFVQEPGCAPVLLKRACSQGDVKMFAALYQTAGLALFRDAALVRFCSNRAMPPLHLACLIEAPELAAALLAYGADVDLPDRSGKTALHYAVERKSLPLVKVLKAAGANSAIASGGKNPVELAAQNGFHSGFAELADTGFWQSRRLARAPLSARRPAQAPRS